MTHEAATLGNRYRAIASLGEGAMGKVYLAHDVAEDREVALKVISHAFGATERSILQFRQEFRLMAQLRHPHCCRVHDYGQLADGAPYFSMEVVPGQGLDELVPVDGEAFGHILGQLLLALGYLHQLGLVHRDVKAANVRVKPDGTVKLMDYGLMEHAGRSGAAISGTPAYLAPEVIRRGPIDRRTDLYALGALAYELLTGSLPFTGGTADVIRAHLDKAPEPPSRLRPGIDPLHERVVLKLLAKDPRERYASAEEVLDALGLEVPAGIGGNLLPAPMLGRDREVEQLGGMLERAAGAGAGGAMVVAAPAGLGKSRLLAELRARAQLCELSYAEGRCVETGDAPYAPVVGLLRQLLPGVAGAAAAEVASRLPVLARLMPDAPALMGLPPVEALQALETPAAEALRMRLAVVDVVLAAARQHALAVILEDWQWADALSVQVVEALAEAAGTLPLVVLAGSRELPPPGSKLVGLALERLSREDVARMIAAMLGQPEADPALVAAVEPTSGGNPFYVERLLAHLVEAGALVRERGRWRATRDLATYEMPGDLDDLLRGQIASLSPDARAVARAAAVVGREFLPALAASVSGLTSDRLFDALAELQRRQMLVRLPEGTYRFRHDRFLTACDADVPAGERAGLHQAVARALQADHPGVAPADLPIAVLFELAGHHLAAADAPEAVPFALAAGTRAAAAHSTSAARRFLEQGLACLQDRPDRHDRAEHLALLVALEGVYRVLGLRNDANELITRALELARELGDRGRLIWLLGSLSKNQQLIADYETALATCAAGLAIPADGCEGERARLLLVQARQLYFTGRPNAAMAPTQEALALARMVGAQAQVAEGLSFLGYLVGQAQPERAAEGVAYLREALAIAEGLGDKTGQVNAYNLLGDTLRDMGAYVAAAEAFGQTTRLTREAQILDELPFTYGNQAMVCFSRGLYREMLALAREGREAAARVGSAVTGAINMVLEGAALVHGGEVAAGLAVSAEGRVRLAGLGSPYFVQALMPVAIDTSLHAGRWAEAEEAIRELADLEASVGAAAEPPQRTVQAAEALYGHGSSLARSKAEQALERAIALGARGIELRCRALLAAVALRDQDFEGARAEGERALALAKELGVVSRQAELEGLLGECQLAAGQPATEAFRRMRAAADLTGCPALVAGAAFRQAVAGSPELATEGARLMAGCLEGLTDADREAYLGTQNRRRILAADYLGFGQPRPKPAAPIHRPGFGPGML